MRRFSFNQPNICSMMLRCRYLGRSNCLGKPGRACASCCAAGLPVASGSGRSNNVEPRRHSPCRPTTNGSVCGDGRAGLGRKPHPAPVEHRRYRWPARLKAESAKARHWHRTACESWSSGRPGCVRARGLAVLQPPFFPSTRRGQGCAYRRGVNHPGIQID